MVRIARFLKWKEFVVASLIMTFVTSLPELFIGISSAIHNKPLLSLGNVVGSNIVVLTLVIGVGSLVAKGLGFEGKTLQRSSLYAAFITPLPLILMLDGMVSRWDGIILYLALIFYFHRLVLKEERFSKVINDILNGKKGDIKVLIKNMGLLLVGVGLLLGASEGAVWSASGLASTFNISLPIIGLLLVSIGTSGPEIMFGIQSISMGHDDMILGDAMGSVVVNSTFVLGTMALIRPFAVVDLPLYFVSILFTIVVVSLFAIFAKTDEKITQREGIFLIFIYVLFLIIEGLIR